MPKVILLVPQMCICLVWIFLISGPNMNCSTKTADTGYMSTYIMLLAEIDRCISAILLAPRTEKY